MNSIEPTNQPIEENTRRKWGLLLALLFAVIFARSPDVLIFPPLQVEDGTRSFAHFYQHRGVGEVLQVWAGYVRLLPGLISFFCAQLPTRLIPYGLTWIPLVLTLLTYSRFFSVRYRPFLSSDATRGFACFILALAPIAVFPVFSQTDFSIWNSLLLLILLTVVPLPSQPRWKYLTWLLINILGWSHPLSAIVLPFLVLRLRQDREHTVFHLATLISLVMYQIFGVKGGPNLIGAGTLEISENMGDAVIGSMILSANVVYRTAFGDPQTFNTGNGADPVRILWILTVLVATIFVYWKNKESRALLIGLSYIILTITFLSIVGRGFEKIGRLEGVRRYVYIPSLACLVLYVGLGETFLRNHITLRRFSALMLIIHYLVINSRMIGHYRPAHPDNGIIVWQFFKDLSGKEKEMDGRNGIYLVANKKNDWPIEIDTRARLID
jgi:hypothetical protein